MLACAGAADDAAGVKRRAAPLPEAALAASSVVSLEEGQGGRLVQLAEQFQGHRIVRLQAGSKLVDQPGLALDQGFQVSAEGFEFLDQGAIRLEGTQVCQVAATSPGQQVSINGIGLGPRGFRRRSTVLGFRG